MQKVYDEQNINILNKAEISITDASFTFSLQYSSPLFFLGLISPSLNQEGWTVGPPSSLLGPSALRCANQEPLKN